MGTQEAGHITGTKDKDYNVIWFVEQCLSNVLRLETYIEDAERGRLRPRGFFRRAGDEQRAPSRARNTAPIAWRCRPVGPARPVLTEAPAAVRPADQPARAPTGPRAEQVTAHRVALQLRGGPVGGVLGGALAALRQLL